MKKSLAYFTIGDAYGGNQEWFTNVVMNIGGCGAATACDSCIYFAKQMGMTALYPYDINHLTKEEYRRFSQIMKPYIRPRVGGVKKLEWYMEGLNKYIQDVNHRENTQIKIGMRGLSGECSYEEASRAVKYQIDAGIPVPYLMLKHKNPEKYKDFIWHWFLVVGYEETKEGMDIYVATYGEETRLSMKELWDTGMDEKGGIVLYDTRVQRPKLT